MTVVIGSGAMTVTNGSGVTVWNTANQYLHCKFLTGSVSLPQYQADASVTVNHYYNQTDSYTLGTVDPSMTIIFGMLRWTTPGTSERLVNDGKWCSYNGQMIQCCWGANDFAATGTLLQDYEILASMATFYIENVGGTVYLRDNILLKAPSNNQSFANRITRTRPASTLDYRIYCGVFQ